MSLRVDYHIDYYLRFLNNNKFKQYELMYELENIYNKYVYIEQTYNHIYDMNGVLSYTSVQYIKKYLKKIKGSYHYKNNIIVCYIPGLFDNKRNISEVYNLKKLIKIPYNIKYIIIAYLGDTSQYYCNLKIIKVNI